MCELLESRRWRFAKTMPDIPHEYVLKDRWEGAVRFERVAAYLKERGRRERWRRWWNHYLYLSGYKYWALPVEDATVLNRQRVDGPSPYDEWAEDYDGMFLAREYLDENWALFKTLDLRGRVLDVGCGTGLAVEWGDIPPERYVGIDPSKGMLQRFAWKHPRYAASLRCCPFEDYWGRGFDTVIALYGVAGWVEGIGRVREMLNPGGRAFLMHADRTGVEVRRLCRGEYRMEVIEADG